MRTYSKMILFIRIGLLSLMIMVLVNISAMAQDFDDNVVDTPVDGGLSLLLAAGAAYGVSRLRRQKKGDGK
jgi:hypothetical protein